MSEKVRGKVAAKKPAARQAGSGQFLVKAAVPKGRGTVTLVGPTAKIYRVGPAVAADDSARALGAIYQSDYMPIFQTPALRQIEIVRQGAPARILTTMQKDMGVPAGVIYDWLKIPSATAKRKVANKTTLSSAESERAINLARLIGQIQAMTQESGSPSDFDARKWAANWLSQPCAALDGRRPGTLLDTAEGYQLLSSLLAQAQSGAYA